MLPCKMENTYVKLRNNVTYVFSILHGRYFSIMKEPTVIRDRVGAKAGLRVCLDFAFIKPSFYIVGFSLKFGLASFPTDSLEFGIGFQSFLTSVVRFVKFPNVSQQATTTNVTWG